MPSASCSKNCTFRCILDYSFQLCFFSSCSMEASCFSCSPMWLDSIKFCSTFILFSSSCSFLFNFAFLFPAYFNDCSQSYIFILSHNNAGLTSSPFSYWARTSWIALRIWLPVFDYDNLLSKPL